MAIREALVLDHFYISLPEEEFQMLLPLVTSLRTCRHKKVESGEDSWEGIYIYSRTGAYFEILKRQTKGPLGIAFSAPKPQHLDVRMIQEEFKELPWSREVVTWADQTPWFEGYSVGEYKGCDNTVFYPWIMHYQFNHREEASYRYEPRTIDRFLELELELGRTYYSEIKEKSQWLPGDQKFEQDSILFEIPDREGSVFRIDVKLTDSELGFKFKSLKMRKNVEIEAGSLEMDKFLLVSNQDLLTLKFK